MATPSRRDLAAHTTTTMDMPTTTTMGDATITGAHSHSHLPPGADGSPINWRSLLSLGISGGLLPCPSAMVLLLTAVAMHRIAFGLALVAAISVGLAGVLTVVGPLFIKDSHLADRTPWFAVPSRWLPAASALLICLLGAGIAWGAIAKILE